LADLIEEYLKRGTHISRSDFIRAAVREKIMRDAPELYRRLFITET